MSPYPECSSLVAMATILVSGTTCWQLGGVSISGSEAEQQEGERQAGTLEPMAMNFQENVTLAMAVFTILASIYFFNKGPPRLVWRSGPTGLHIPFAHPAAFLQGLPTGLGADLPSSAHSPARPPSALAALQPLI
ncbi:hypothetical protein TREES_T100006310 [Tupaia chinensis]|uniref:Uncharacterized protein n=1 Tax=Tupaia chinensis TaxID=246437 RepID=L9L664_TUPCH|nr:hypothetical protein TREES_T100006310 [Tupaia chinensis]